MKNNVLILAAVAAALAGCAQLRDIMQPARVKGCSTNCFVEVIVAETDGGKGCRITAPDKQHVIHVADGKWDVRWQIRGSAFEFDPNDGIRFVGPPAGVFTKKQGGGSTFVYEDKNDHPGAKGNFPYHIHVVSRNGQVRCRLDPSVIND